MGTTVWGGKPPLVLVVDDQDANLRLLGRVLGEAGFDLMPADSGPRALARLEAAIPDVILLDMRMPAMDGFAVLERIQGNPAWADLPVIFLTAAHERELLVRAFAGGAVDYLTKPFVAEELVARVRTHAELKRSRDQLRAAIREREDMASIVVHDLKNPLFNISLNAQLLLDGADADSDTAQRARAIQNSARKALDFVERALQKRAGVELQRGFAPEAHVVAALFDAVEEELDEARSRAQQQVVRSPLPAQQLACDRDATLVVLRNLLSNAIKYSPPGSEIELGASVGAGGRMRLWVADRGPGVSAAEKSKLFRRYVRLSAEAQGPAAASSGVGLALARQQAEWMGGELWHEDRPGGGSVFVLTLPMAGPDTPGYRRAE
jgi:two-component system, sensor histidine kinase and response regulator